jgi:hypothetical protein
MIYNAQTKKYVKTFLATYFSTQEKKFIDKEFTMRWRAALDEPSYQCFKIYAEDSQDIQGLLCIEILPPIFVVALESAAHNRWLSSGQHYKGVGTELLAHAYLLSKQKGFEGEILIESKEETLSFYSQAAGKREDGTNFFTFSGAASRNLIKRL